MGRHSRARWRWLAVAIVWLLSAAMPAYGQEPVFDHLQSGFPLIGAHRRIPCESCHAGGAFEGTPTDCRTCHGNTGSLALTGKPANHIQTSSPCEDCHSTIAWSPARFDHTGVTAACSTCHNGTTATGKSATHLPTANSCDDCHTTAAWSPARFDHTGVTAACSTLPQRHDRDGQVGDAPADGEHLRRLPHDHGVDAPRASTTRVSRRPARPATTARPRRASRRRTCRRRTPATTATPPRRGRPARFDHAGVTGACSTCHNGTTATGKSRDAPARRANTCDDCHTTTAWTPARFDHAGVTAPARPATTARPRRASRRRTCRRANTCDDCHTTAAWTPARFDHAGVTAACSTCHNGTTATGKSPTHLPTANTCDDCHTTTAWSPARFDHTGVTAACSTCHNGTTATGKSATHLPTHEHLRRLPHDRGLDAPRASTTRASPAACSTCHNGTTATGKPPITSPTANACDDCHTTAAWTPARFDHTGVTASCGTCHNGTHRHRQAEQSLRQRLDCGECHNTSVWSPATFQHSSPNYPSGHRQVVDCSGCHVANTEAIAWLTPIVQARLRGLSRDRLQAGSAQEGRLAATALLGERAARLHRRLPRLHRRDADADPGTPQRRAQRGAGRLVIGAPRTGCALLALCCARVGRAARRGGSATRARVDRDASRPRREPTS